MTLDKIRIGFGVTGSFCTFSRIFPVMEQLTAEGADLWPILSPAAAGEDTRFLPARQVRSRMAAIAGREPWTTLQEVEPIGPRGLLDLMVVAPCTGNTLAKLAHGITDTAVTMAVKAHLRNGRPVVIAVSTNDGLSASAANLGSLLNRRHYYFVPFGQDDPQGKPCSTVARMELIPRCCRMALEGRQLQPLLTAPGGGAP